MTATSASDLDRLYTLLAEALGRVGEKKASLLLATLALDLIAHGEAEAAATAIVRAEELAIGD